MVRDITERERAAATVEFEARALELVATGQPAARVFAALVLGMERLTHEGLCSMVLLEGRIQHVAMAPSLPPAYCAAIEGVEIGPEAGSCGAAAFHGRGVVVEDIATHPPGPIPGTTRWRMGCAPVVGADS